MLCAPIPVSEAVLFYVNAPFSAGLAGCRSQHPALRGRPYFAAGPAPAGTPCAHSERRGARRTFPAGKAKRPPFGREPRGQHCLQRACHFTQDMPQTGRASRRGLRAGPAPPRRDALCPFREVRGGPPFRERRPQGHVLCGARKAARFTRGFVLRPFFAMGVSVAAPCRSMV